MIKINEFNEDQWSLMMKLTHDEVIMMILSVYNHDESVYNHPKYLEIIIVIPWDL